MGRQPLPAEAAVNLMTALRRYAAHPDPATAAAYPGAGLGGEFAFGQFAERLGADFDEGAVEGFAAFEDEAD
jgi:hypothetical protein